MSEAKHTGPTFESIEDVLDSPNSALQLIGELWADRDALLVALKKIWEVASGESQVSIDDTAGMEWISDYASTVWDEATEQHKGASDYGYYTVPLTPELEEELRNTPQAIRIRNAQKGGE